MAGYEIIALDLDGTLTNNEKIITPRTKNALLEWQERGKKLVLASGRPTVGMMHLAEELSLSRYHNYVMAFNGAVIIDCGTDKVISESLMPVSANQRVWEISKKKGVDLFTYEGTTLLTNNMKNPYAIREKEIDRLSIRQIDDMGAYLDFPVPKLVLTADGEILEPMEASVREVMGEDYNVYRSEPYYLEVLAHGIDKGSCLLKLLKLTGLKKEQAIACGDGYNDLTMIQCAGLGVAMDNAVPAVKEAADYITLSNEEDGVAHVVEKFMR